MIQKSNILSVLFLFLIPYSLYANGGSILLILFLSPTGITIFALIPIVIIEMIYLKKTLSIRTITAGTTTLLGNIASTLVGTALSFLIILPSLSDMSYTRSHSNSLTSVASVIKTASAFFFALVNRNITITSINRSTSILVGSFMLLFFFFLSWWVEYMIAKRMLKKYTIDAQIINHKIRNANIITYILLFCAFIIGLITL